MSRLSRKNYQLGAAEAASLYAGRGKGWNDLGTGWFIGHRGGRYLGPEESLELARLCVGAGFASEIDVQHLVDGTLVPSHDTTTTRTMSGTSATISSLSPPQWMQRNHLSSAVFGGAGAWDDTVKASLVSQWISEFANKQVLVPQVNSTKDAQRFMDMLDAAGVNKKSVILQGGATVAICDAIVARGYTATYTPAAGAPTADDISTCVSHGIEWIQGDRTVWSQADVDACHAAGLRVALYTANRRSDVARFTGVDAWYSDDPWYASGSTTFERTTDPFSGLSWVPGLFGAETDAANRGKFYTDGYWGMDLSASSTTMVGHFYLAPPNPSAYTLDFSLAIDAVHTSGTTAAYLYLGQSDKYWNDQPPATTSNDGPQGYVVRINSDGTAQFYRKDYSAHTSTALGSVTIASAPTLGTVYPYRLTVAASTLSLQRLDGGAVATMTKTDSTFRNLRYIQLGRAGAGVRYGSMTAA